MSAPDGFPYPLTGLVGSQCNAELGFRRACLCLEGKTDQVVRMVVPPRRQGGQAQFIKPLRETPAIDRFSEVVEWVQHNPDQPHTLDCLAAKAFMSRRTFTRRFRQATGTTVGTWLLETSSASVDSFAHKAGFGSEVSLRQHFSKVLQTAPSRYRREFRGK